MPAHPKRRKRLLLLAGAVVLLGAAVGGAFVFRRTQLDRGARESRDEGRKALAAKDWTGALRGLRKYLQRFEKTEATAQDLRDFAQAFRHVPQPNSAHLYGAIAVLRKALDKEPDFRPAQDDLLELYTATGFASEALDLLAQMVAAHPDDVGLLRQQRDWFETQRKFHEALTVAKQICELEPRRYDGFVSTWNLLGRTDTLPTDVSDWIDSVVATHAGDARFEMLRSAELTRRGEAAQAKAILDRFLDAPIDASDPTFVTFLVGQLDAADRFADAVKVLEGLGDGVDVSLKLDLCRRLWFVGRVPDLVTRSAAWGVDPSSANAEILALRILALTNLGRTPEAEPLREALRAREDASAKAWVAFLEQVADGKLAGGREAVEALEAAVSAEPGSAILRQAFGDALSRLGDRDRALRAWGEASVRAPSWAVPLMSLARELPSARGSEVIGLARAALRRAPGDSDAVATYVDVCARYADTLDATERAAMLAGIATYRTQMPEHATELIAAEVGMMLHDNRAQAESRLRELLAERTAAGEATLLRLARIAAQAKLPMESELLDLCESLHGATPQLALARAMSKERQSGAEAGVRVISELRARRAQGTAELDWDIVRAGYLDAVRHRDAADAWKGLSEQNPKSLPVQLGALASPAVWRDRELARQVIERLHELTGDDASPWRTARAKWLLSASQATDAELHEAAEMVEKVVQATPGSVSARVLQANALERMGRIGEAQDSLLAAAETAPDDPWIALELARVAQRAGNPDLAMRQIDRALRSDDRPPEQTQRAAFLLAIRGDLQRSADLLEPIAQRSQTDREGTLLLARLYAQLGKTERALELCGRLLVAPDADVVAFAAELYATTGRLREAEGVLTKLDGLDLPAGEASAIRARFAARRGAPAAAGELMRQATVAAPGRADLWSERFAILIQGSDAAQLQRALDESNSVETDAGRFLRTIPDLWPGALADERLRPVLAAAAASSEARPAMVEVMRLVVAAGKDPARCAECARAVRTAAEANSTVLALQNLAARLAIDVGDFRGAAEIGARAAAAFPRSEEAAMRAFEGLVRGQRWDDALAAGLRWRDRAAPGDLRAELAVARVRLRLDHAVDAATGLEANLATALARPAANDEFLVVYALALVRAGRRNEASDLLQRLARGPGRWRELTLGLGASWLGDADDALHWLRACSPLVPEDDRGARLQLARAWGAAWEQYRTPELLAGAQEVLDAVTTGPSPGAEPFFLQGTLAQQAGDVDGARAAYQSAIAQDASHAGALNNLAMLVVESGAWEEAADLAGRAVKVKPGEARYHDTLALAYRRGGQLDKARASLEEATKLEPLGVSWWLSLAELESEAGQSDRMAAALERVRAIDQRGYPLSESARTRLARLQPPR